MDFVQHAVPPLLELLLEPLLELLALLPPPELELLEELLEPTHT